MGRYTYPCPGNCGAQLTQKTGIQDSHEITHQLCATCQEKARDSAKEASGKSHR